MMKKMLLVLIILLLNSYSISLAKDQTPSHISYTELEGHISEFVEAEIGETVAGANIVIVKDGEIFMQSSFGYANREEGIPISADTVFEWGSVSKLLVWTSVMQLVEQGKLDLETDIRTYLPPNFLKNLTSKEPITMMNLMHHNAGWEDRLLDLFYTSEQDVKPLSEMLQLTEPKQVFPPGEIVAYSNYGVALAGYIVELIANKPFYEYVDENIFSVLAMHDTTFHPTQADHPEIKKKRADSLGYTSPNFQPVVNERIFIGIYPAGSAMGTIEDMTKFMIALMPKNDEATPLFKNVNTLDEMLTTSDFYSNGYARNAHGFWEGLYKVRVVEHAGNTEGFTSNFSFSPEESLGIIILMNQKNESKLNYDLPNLIFGTYNSPNVQTPTNLEQFNGTYMNMRQPFHGFSKIYGVLRQMNIDVVDDSTFQSYGMHFKEIDEDLFESDSEFPVYLHSTFNESNVLEKISSPTYDMVPLPNTSKFFQLFSVIALASCIILWLSMIIVSLIKWIKSKGAKLPFIEKWNLSLNIGGLLVLVNIIFLIVRAANYVPSNGFSIHFLINYLYIGLTLLSIAILLVTYKNTNVKGTVKLKYALPTIMACVFMFLLIAWEFYY